MKVELKTLFEGVDGINEEFVNKMQPMFEAAVEQGIQTRLDEATSALNEQIQVLEQQLVESAATNNVERARLVAEGMDNFLNRVVTQWANDNSTSIQNQSLAEAAQNFLARIVEGAAEMGAIIPDSKRDILAETEARLLKMESKANDLLKENSNLQSKLIQNEKRRIVERASKGMNVVNRDRLRESAMRAPFQGSDQFKSLVEAQRVLIESKKTVTEDDLFDDGKEKKSKQDSKGGMRKDEEFVDGTDKDYPLNIKESDDWDDDDEEDEEEGKGKDKDDKDQKKDDKDDKDKGDKKDLKESALNANFGHLFKL